MTIKKTLCVVLLVSMSGQALAQTSNQYRPYNIRSCVGLMAPGFDLDDGHSALDQQSSAPTSIPGIARARLTDDVNLHYAEQCELMKADEPYDDTCPVGVSLDWDAYVQDAFDEFLTLDAGGLRGRELEAFAHNGETRQVMIGACKK